MICNDRGHTVAGVWDVYGTGLAPKFTGWDLYGTVIIAQHTYHNGKSTIEHLDYLLRSCDLRGYVLRCTIYHNGKMYGSI